MFKGLFGEGPLTFAGKHYVVTSLDGFPKPVQRPRPPLLIGAAGKRMLSIAAREADIIGFQTVSTANGMMVDDPSGRLAPAVAQRVEQVRQVAGGRFREIELSMVATVVFTKEPRPAAEQLAHDRGWKDVASEQVLEMPSVFIGSLEHIVDEMRARRERATAFPTTSCWITRWRRSRRSSRAWPAHESESWIDARDRVRA